MEAVDHQAEAIETGAELHQGRKGNVTLVAESDIFLEIRCASQKLNDVQNAEEWHISKFDVINFECPGNPEIHVSLHQSYNSNLHATLNELRYRNPFCENILYNLSNGQWVKKIDSFNKNEIEYKKLLKEERELDYFLTEFRINRGIHTRLWRDDYKCGFNNVQTKPRGNAWAAPAGSWCDSKSNKPCCSDIDDGQCGSICDCPNCVDTRKIYHAEISDWIPFDSACRRRNYTAAQACKVVNRFSQIYFVGDSFVGKMARGFVLTLRSDLMNGCLVTRYDEKLTKLCVGVDQFYWTECSLGEGEILKNLVNKTPFCGKDTPLVNINGYYNHESANRFLNLVKSLTGKVGSVLLVGQGGHDGCKSEVTMKTFLSPVIQHLDDFYKKFDNTTAKHSNKFNNIYRWPHIIFMYPDSNGILKPKAYHAASGDVVCKKFSREMKVYCDAHNIPVLDFSSLTSGVHSYDGTHHGLGVNIMKVQILLNYLDYVSESVDLR
uniref:uncharacterized protein LOC120338079 n=1 Tax=Styela clava TaxID=7725 RepID=UPI00193ACAFB|nr:uncharacterized protein LOC120338079 [Styela clava]